MKVYLIKANRITTDFILLEADDKFVYKSSGKVGKSGIANSTLNAGSPEKAILEIHRQVEDYKKLKYIIADMPVDIVNRDTVFDKAKWHLNEQFPKELDSYQSYVHTGLYIVWLIECDFIDKEFRTENLTSILKLLSREITPAKFYQDQLDGVFDAGGLTQVAIKFTIEYFDFEKGNYVSDYLSTLDPDKSLPSIFHITDSWNNYDHLKPVLNRRFAEWRQKELL